MPTMTCKETLGFYSGVSLGGSEWPRAKRAERVEEVLAAVGLAHAVNTLVGCGQLLGERTRDCLEARAFMGA